MSTDAIIRTINAEHPGASAEELARRYVEQTGIDAWNAQLIAELYVRAVAAEESLTVSQNVTAHLQARLAEHDELIKQQREMLNALRVKLPATSPLPRV